jgi:pyrimidine operon attenuation protein/uracil phosphoribosyltransferase
MEHYRQQIFNTDEINRAVARIAQDMLERNVGLDDIVLVGIHRQGVPLARRIAAELVDTEGQQVPVGQIDVTLYRDDVRIRRSIAPMHRTIIPVDISGRVVILVDDVLYTGRTVRAALNALTAFGRPARIQLAVLVDRGHRELPLRADFVGKHVPTSREESVQTYLSDGTMGKRTDGASDANHKDEVIIVPASDD